MRKSFMNLTGGESHFEIYGIRDPELRKKASDFRGG